MVQSRSIVLSCWPGSHGGHYQMCNGLNAVICSALASSMSTLSPFYFTTDSVVKTIMKYAFRWINTHFKLHFSTLSHVQDMQDGIFSSEFGKIKQWCFLYIFHPHLSLHISDDLKKQTLCPKATAPGAPLTLGFDK